MTSEVDVVNRALSSLGTRSSIAALNENSPESRTALVWLEPLRDELLRLAPWNCCKNYIGLSLICAAPGTPENPTQVALTWQKGIPAPPWIYEYAYPADCIRPLWIVPQFTTGFSGQIPITTAITGGPPTYWNGPPVRFQVAIDQIDQNTGLPSNTGIDQKVILTNQEQAILCYNRQITDPNIMDSQFVQAWVAALASRMAMQMTGDKGLAQLKVQEANQFIIQARVGDGNEGLTVNNVTPDWIRIRGVDYIEANFTPTVDWGNLLTIF